MKSIPKVKISLSTPICLAAFAAIYGVKYIASIVLSVILHELGHITAIYLFNERISEITLRPFGAVIKRAENRTSYIADAMISLAGPAVNIFSFIICAYFGALGTFAYASLVFALVNLIPANPLDGYSAMRALTLRFFPMSVSEKICTALSLIVLCVIWIFTVYMIIFTQFNLSLLIMTTLLICETVISRK